MDWPDELALLKWLAADGELRVFRKFGETPDSLWIDDWSERPIAADAYGVWPRRFAWEPTTTRLTEPCAAGLAGMWWFSNASTGPVIQVSRHMHGPSSAGRLYWSKRSLELARGPLAYDVEAFDGLISGVWRWVRKHGARDASKPGAPFVLPSARERTEC